MIGGAAVLAALTALFALAVFLLGGATASAQSSRTLVSNTALGTKLGQGNTGATRFAGVLDAAEPID